MSKPLIRPPALRKGGTIGVFTPSSPANVDFREKYRHGIKALRGLGLGVVEGPLTAKTTSDGYRSGTPKERAADFMALIRDPQVDALMATIGGMNSSSMIPYLDFDAIRAHPKIICGYSDVTSLHCAILTLSGLSTFYGPAVVPSFGDWPQIQPETLQSFLEAVRTHTAGPRPLRPPPRWSNHVRDAMTTAWKTEERIFQENPGWKTLVPGNAKGEAVIMGLNALTAAAGTPYFPDLDGVILFVENMDGPLAREERVFRHLERMGVFDRIAGFVLGKYESTDTMGASFGHDELLLEVMGPRTYPVVTGFDCAHTMPMLTMAQRVPVTLSARGGYDVEVVIEGPMVTPGKS